VVKIEFEEIEVLHPWRDALRDRYAAHILGTRAHRIFIDIAYLWPADECRTRNDIAAA